MDAAGSERATIVGVSEGGQNSVLFAATYPERTAGLVLIASLSAVAFTDELAFRERSGCERRPGGPGRSALGWKGRFRMRKWGFIYTLGPEATEVRHDRLGTAACELICIGIPSVDGAAEAARSLASDDVELIELCGAFGAAGLAAVLAEVDGHVPVGAVFYGGESATGLHGLFGPA